IRIAVEEGIGAAFVSAVVAAEGIRAGRLVPVTVNGLELAQTLYLARHTGRPATGAQAAFWDYAFAPENASLRALTNRPVIASNEDGYDTPDVIIARDTH
ncbi:MAG TPA: LysR substrate-binding domain-containing protein, partial [Aggregatilineales bacterium]|nr:LysR substrate-binding domain-containing protein [Aggregatilineales bacterium]